MPDPVVYVIDDDDAVRDSIALLLSSFGHRVRAYANAQEFLSDIDEGAGGCVVTDIRMPGASGIDLLAHLKEKHHSLPVILITGHGDIPLAVQAMKLGASDFLEKPFQEDQLPDAVARALAQRGAVSQEETLEARAKVASLSQRERQTLEALIKGHPNKVIAHQLGISPRTVEIHRANLMTKLGASNLPEVVRIALHAGLDN